MDLMFSIVCFIVVVGCGERIVFFCYRVKEKVSLKIQLCWAALDLRAHLQSGWKQGCRMACFRFRAIRLFRCSSGQIQFLHSWREKDTWFLRYGQHFFCFLIKKKFCHTETFLLTASNEKHLTDFVNATKLHLRRGGGARLVNFNRGQFNEMPSSTMSTELRIFSHLVNGIRKESVGFCKLSKKAFAFNVWFSKKNDRLTFNVIRFIDFQHGGRKLMFLGQSVKNYLFKKSVLQHSFFFE